MGLHVPPPTIVTPAPQGLYAIFHDMARCPFPICENYGQAPMEVPFWLPWSGPPANRWGYFSDDLTILLWYNNPGTPFANVQILAAVQTPLGERRVILIDEDGPLLSSYQSTYTSCGITNCYTGGYIELASSIAAQTCAELIGFPLDDSTFYEPQLSPSAEQIIRLAHVPSSSNILVRNSLSS